MAKTNHEREREAASGSLLVGLIDSAAGAASLADIAKAPDEQDV